MVARRAFDGKAAESGGTKIYLAGNWGLVVPTGSTNDWIGHGVNTWTITSSSTAAARIS